MAVIRWVEKYASMTGASDADFQRIYRRVYVATTDGNNNDPISVGNYHLAPRRGEIWRAGAFSDPGAICQNLEVEQDDSQANVWIITATYSTQKNPAGGPAQGPQFLMPVDQPVIWEKGTWFKELVVEWEPELINGKRKLVANTAGQKYDTPIVRQVANTHWTARKNLEVFPDDLKDALEGSINRAIWRDKKAGTVWLESITGSQQYDHGMPYWSCVFSFKIDRDGWDVIRLQAGTRYWERDDEGKKILVDARDDEEQLTSESVPLDHSGFKLSAADVALRKYVYNDGVDPNPPPHKVYPRKDWGALNVLLR